MPGKIGNTEDNARSQAEVELQGISSRSQRAQKNQVQRDINQHASKSTAESTVNGYRDFGAFPTYFLSSGTRLYGRDLFR